MRRSFLLLVTAFIFVSNGFSQSVSVRVGTLGPGVDFSLPLTASLSVRVGGSYLAYTHSERFDDDEVDVDFHGDHSWGGVNVLADWFPFSKGLRFTGGVYYNLIKLKGSGVPTSPYFLNEGQSNQKVFQPERLGTLEANLTYAAKINPYAGVGFGGGQNNGRISFTADMGVAYLGSPKIEMQGTGMISGTANQDRMLTEGVESFKWLPVLSFGLAVRLGSNTSD